MAAALNPALVFIGFMAAGKSTAALEAAAALGETAADSDALLEAELGERIQAYFDRAGEAGVPRRGGAARHAMLDRADGGVIALGGGAVLSERTRAALRRHTVVLVDVDLETAWGRAAARAGRSPATATRSPGCSPARAALYEDAADAIVPGTGDPHVVRRALPARCARRRTG